MNYWIYWIWIQYIEYIVILKNSIFTILDWIIELLNSSIFGLSHWILNYWTFQYLIFHIEYWIIEEEFQPASQPASSQPASKQASKQAASKLRERKSSFFASIFHQRYSRIAKSIRSKIEKIKLGLHQRYSKNVSKTSYFLMKIYDFSFKNMMFFINP